MVNFHSLANLLVFPWVKPQVLINPAVCCICTLTEPVESCYRKFQAEAHITIEEWCLPSFGYSVLPQYSMYPNCPSLRLFMVAIPTLWMSQASEHTWSAGTSHRKKSDRMTLLWPSAVNFWWYQHPSFPLLLLPTILSKMYSSAHVQDSIFFCLFKDAFHKLFFLLCSLFLQQKCLFVTKFQPLNLKFDIFTSILKRKNNNNKWAHKGLLFDHTFPATCQLISLLSFTRKLYMFTVSVSSNLHHSPRYCSLPSFPTVAHDLLSPR